MRDKMKNGVAIFLACLSILQVNGTPLLGAKECTWGPSHWCSSLENAKNCNAVRHCIQTVWEKQTVPVDNDSICQICKDMVTQARDQLRSNETMEDLRAVFEGTCNLIPIKIVKKDCIKLADNFIPELVEALSSQMNPDQVCSVAGLCNNAKIDEMLTTYYSSALDGTLTEEPPTITVGRKTTSQLSCGKCNDIATIITNKFTAADRDDILDNILSLCGKLSSFSDACANIVLTYFNDIYDHLNANLVPAGICHISGVCASNYHQHPEDIAIDKQLTKTDETIEGGGDDIPCELCEQLIHHLRDLLVANTTEMEFKQVLDGLCKQTKGFKDECISIVDQYYDVIYQSLVNNLDANGACFLIGVCPKGQYNKDITRNDIMPLLPVLPPAKIEVTMRKKLGNNEPKYTSEDIDKMTLPIDHLMGAANPELLVDNGNKCVLCEYVLHFIQEEMSSPATEDEIKKRVNGICNKFSTSIRGTCHNFIDMYGDAVIALLVQGLDPTTICPRMQMCPQNLAQHDSEFVFGYDLSPTSNDLFGSDIKPAAVDNDKPTCPLCLFAVEQAQQKIKNDKSKKNIQNVLHHLCSHLPSKIQGECIDFVETYSSELIDMLITDFKPQEICVALKLCTNTNTFLSDMGIILDDDTRSDEFEDIVFNEIDDSSEEEEMPVEIVFEKHDETSSPNCFLCEEVIKTVEKRIGKHTTKEDIKKALDNSCDKLRPNIKRACHRYVEKHGDQIAVLIQKELDPKIICREIGLCLWSETEDMKIDEALKYDVVVMPGTSSMASQKSDRFTGNDDILTEPPTCMVCEFVMTKLETDLKNKTTQDEIKHTIETVCNHMPKTVVQGCNKFVDQYANAIIALIGTVPPKEICQKLQLCFQQVINDDVTECGVCHGVSSSLLPLFKERLDDQNSISYREMIATACEILPAKYYEICSEMIRVYGQSIKHLSTTIGIDESNVCAQIGKCFNNEKSSLAFAKISA